MDKQSAEPVVPKRKDPKKVEVYARSRAFELAGRDPGSKYQWMSKDPSNPSFYGKFTKRHEVGNAATQYAQADAWEFVSSAEGVTTGRPRDDQGKPIDTALHNGDLVLMKTTAENYAAYEEIERRQDALQARAIGSDKMKIPGASHTHRVAINESITPEELIQRQGA
jgi:hypothetical protein